MNLGLSDEQFWNLSFRELDALCEQYKQNQKRRDYRAGLQAAMTYNAYSKKTAQPLDFFGYDEKQSSEEMLKEAEKLNMMFGGDDNRG